MNKYRALKMLLGVWTGTAAAQGMAREARTYVAFIGNHSSINLVVDDEGVRVREHWDNGSETSYAALLSGTSLKVEPLGGQSRDDVPGSLAFRQDMRRVRDLVSFVAGPAAYDNLYSGTDYLHPELNGLIVTLSTMAGDTGDDLTNCLLWTPELPNAPWRLSGGLVGDLGPLRGKIAQVWVRRGYELLLVSNEQFITSDVLLLLVRGDGTASDDNVKPASADLVKTPLLSGAVGKTYLLTATPLDGRAAAAICRPTLP